MVSLQEILEQIKSQGKYWIVFVGDSITSCEWVHPNWREIVEYVLKGELTKFSKDWKIPSWGIRCFNFGYDGATSRDILQKIDDIKLVKPDLAILMIGVNDPILGVGKDEHEENIEKILNRFRKDRIDFVFSTNNKPWNRKTAERYEPYVEVDKNATFRKKQFINLFEISESFPSERIYTFRSEEIPEAGIKEGDLDYWHPNQLGNAYIAKVILKEIFGIDFDPEKYWKDTLAGEKYPGY